jgi:hypothetical protein
MEIENDNAASAKNDNAIKEEIQWCPFKRMKLDADSKDEKALETVTTDENKKEVSNGDDGENLQADTSDEFVMDGDGDWTGELIVEKWF